MSHTPSDDEGLREELLKYFWPHPYPISHPPLEVVFGNGLPTSGSDRVHKTFVVPYSLFEKAIEALISQKIIEAKQVGHWYGRAFGRDANGFELGHECNCGYKSRNKQSIEQHVTWKLAELQATLTTKQDTKENL